ncbi:MAG: response regulator [Clostridiales Family XIII bacterium]|jgi:putative two-component system response regulator|nr:response regulator [Clostridiales Family XIII bacterium]
MSDSEKKIIITIDDDPIILNQIMSILKDAYTVRPFTSGEAAIGYLDGHGADLILLDCNMPGGMSGFDVLARLQEKPLLRAIPVIFLTGSADGDDEIAALDSGAMDYLLKPIKDASLAKRVALQLELQSYRNELEEKVAEKTEELQDANKKLLEREKITLDLLARAGDMRDHDTGEHILRVTNFVRVIVKDLLDRPKKGYEMTQALADDITEAAKLHDIGKIAMPDNVLLKPGKLTADEWDIIKTHPYHGAQMLEDAVAKLGDDHLLGEALNIAVGHHEKWNGHGYPKGLAGANIPLSARITAIADVFDALTSERPYKQAFSDEDAFRILYADAGTHFDPYLIEVVRRHEEDFRRIRKGRKEGE